MSMFKPPFNVIGPPVRFRIVRNENSMRVQYKSRIGIWMWYRRYDKDGVGCYAPPYTYIPTWSIMPYQQTDPKAIEEIKQKIHADLYGLYGTENVSWEDSYRPLP